MSAATGAGPGSTARHRALADQLVDLVLAEGFAGLTLDDLAARLRCSKSTLYALAGSKEQLVRLAVVRFFAGATARVEAAVAGVAATGSGGAATARVETYLRAVADVLAPASSAFLDDVCAHPGLAEIYARNTRIAAGRVTAMVADGVAAGEFRPVRADFVADVVAVTMVRIHRREVQAATGLDDAGAYAALADLVLHALAPEPPGA